MADEILNEVVEDNGVEVNILTLLAIGAGAVLGGIALFKGVKLLKDKHVAMVEAAEADHADVENNEKENVA